ncbi:hypothetical protein FXN63_15525 [Pigmentiphaga aceris]|uniref:Uncharacterized protein n=1 Tax=Pigmentiphaga aceris TaxID=1940612 RepID=A0A5C0B1R7_9BURK|nr:hypothetical protein [Pigmentiphaga aceris]QEI07090.1 hypothetical protein FXN63_15525 [Pigmentiphaga aceris]
MTIQHDTTQARQGLPAAQRQDKRLLRQGLFLPCARQPDAVADHCRIGIPRKPNRQSGHE